MWSSKVSVVVPTLDEERSIGRCLDAIRTELPAAEIVVVDAGSRDATVALAEQRGARVLRSAPSRGGQCRLGASETHGEVLCFFHADTELERGAGRAIRRFVEAGHEIATLRLRYPEPKLVYAYIGLISRFDSYFSSMGDQGIVVRRSLYDAIGGMPELPLFEDVELFRRARRRARVRSLDARIIVSTRRYDEKGLYRQLGLNLALMSLYAIGVPASRLARWYRWQS